MGGPSNARRVRPGLARSSVAAGRGSAVASDPLHNDLSLHLDGLGAGQTLYVRVSSAASDAFGIGAYQLQVRPQGALGWAANETSQPMKAAPALNKALELDHELGDAYWQRGVLLHAQGANVDALRDLQTALEKRPSRYEAWATIAL